MTPKQREELSEIVREAVRAEAQCLRLEPNTEELMRRAVRAENINLRMMPEFELPLLVDYEAQCDVLSARLKGIIGRPYHGLSSEHFWGEAHQELWSYGGRLDWVAIREVLCGDSVRSFYELLDERAPLPPDALRERAFRIKELHAQRELVSLFKRLEAEMRLGELQACDAEHELQEYLLKDT